MTSKYKRFLKRLIVSKAPEGLFPPETKAFWMESRDLEGYQGHIGIAYIEKACTLHPVDKNKTIVHQYDELILLVGTNPEDMLDLGGEATIIIGEEREEYLFQESTVIAIPRKTPHGPLKIEKLGRPMINIILSNSPSYSADFLSCSLQTSKGLKYSDHVKRLFTSKSAYETWLSQGPVKIDERGVMDLRSASRPGESYQIVQMTPEDLKGINISFSWEFFKTTGTWMSTRYAHVHPEPELLAFLSLDPSRIDDLGASVEFWFGSEREVYVIDRPTLVTIPRPWIPHTPVVTQRVDRPFAFMLVVPGTYSFAGYVETGDDVY
ncbi:MAG: hypothetical protein QW701_02660 [Candidatus Nezhaarchaeales archaeon]